MKLLKAFAIPLLGLLVLVLSSCGTTTTSSPPPSSNAPTPTPTTSAATPTSSTSSAGNVVVKTATITVGGKQTTVLTNVQGMTLYYFTPDTATTTACTGGCASNWPPLLASGSQVAASTQLSGALATLNDANGDQVTYNGHPLYTYKADSAPGQANGQGVGGKWFVATPDLAKQ